MRINNITLVNIGPYKGKATLDLSTTRGRNIVLIGGKNGAGKTTLLKALKIGLFGCFAFGYKNENTSYFSEIRSILNNDSAGQNHEIIISFDLVEHYEKKNYTIKRYWNLSENLIEEDYKVWENNAKLSGYQGLEFFNRLKSLTSPALLNSFIYDGERIGLIVEQNKLSQYLMEVFNSIFNINLLNQLNNDLTAYLVKASKIGANSTQYELTQVIKDIGLARTEISTYEDKINELRKYIENIRLNIKSRRMEFLTLEGLSTRQIDEFRKNISSFVKENDEGNRLLKVYYEDFLPFKLVRAKIREIVEKAQEEMPLRYAGMLVEIQQFLKVDLSSYIEQLHAKSKDILFDLTNEQIQILKQLLVKIDEEHERAMQILQRKSDGFQMTSSMKQQVENTEATEKLRTITEQINEYQAELIEKEEELAVMLRECEDKKLALQRLINRYEQLNSQIRKDKLSDRSHVLCTMAYEISNTFGKNVTDSMLKKVSGLACEIFNDTIRKQNYISELILDDKFNLKVVNGKNKVIEMTTFSAGEIQILVSSIIWAMFKLSGRREMFVFDTPLARLDSENRLLFVNKIVKTISDQVVILSTDSEFIGANYDAVRDSINRSYLLLYNDSEKRSEIVESYFVEE